MSNNDDQVALKAIMDKLAKELSLTMSSDEKKEFAEGFKVTLVEDISLLKKTINFYQEEIKRSTEMISAIENDPVSFFDNNGPAGFPVTEEYTAAKAAIIYRAIGDRIQEILDSKNPSTDDLIELEMLYGDQYDILVAMRNSAHWKKLSLF